jgi:Tfp pilus assembly protein PilV
MKISISNRPASRSPRSAFTLAEVVVSVLIASISIGGIIYAYILASHQAEWSANSSAAQLMAMRRLEQVRAARWDPLAYPEVDNLISANFTNVIAPLEVPQTGTNFIWSTNVTTITKITNNAVWKKIQVDCSWAMKGRGGDTNRMWIVATNTVITYRAPDQ